MYLLWHFVDKAFRELFFILNFDIDACLKLKLHVKLKSKLLEELFSTFFSLRHIKLQIKNWRYTNIYTLEYIFSRPQNDQNLLSFQKKLKMLQKYPPIN